MFVFSKSEKKIHSDKKLLLRFLYTALHCGLFSGQNVSFVHTGTLMTWTEAQSFCREHYTDLASVRNEAENQKVQELALKGGYVWIGLFRDSWKWSDGRDYAFTYWTDGEPDGFTETCVLARFGNSGLWIDWFCDSKAETICYSKLSFT